MATPTLVPSSTTLWATPSKEWVIQPKPKPGRKPKKDAAVTSNTDDVDGKGRRVQNRAAQRAFRERKQSQLAELQARVQSYEQGEIERNVALQNIAKRLKEENEALRRENTLLKEKISTLEKERLPNENEKKRRDNSSSVAQSRKRQRTDGERNDPSVSHSMTFSSASPPSMASSPDSYASSDSPFSPIPLDSQLPSHSSSNDVFGLAPPDKPDGYVNHSSFVTCGFCSEDTICVCREAFPPSTEVMVPKAEVFEPTASSGLISIGTPPPPSPPSILENLPAFQPAVPLRRRQTASTNPIPPVALSSQPSATCTGDPSNCLACADDSFGKAFCAALGKSVAAQSSSCPCPETNFSVDPAVTSLRNNADSHPPLPSSTFFSQQLDDETIPTNDAWKQLKSHPNVAFSDLALLADVVARRSKCTGPRVVISPAPGTLTPERTASPAHPVSGLAGTGDSEAVLLTDPHAHYHEQRARSSPPRLVPQEILLQCGQERLRQVQAAGVREALRLLDAKFSSS